MPFLFRPDLAYECTVFGTCRCPYCAVLRVPHPPPHPVLESYALVAGCTHTVRLCLCLPCFSSSFSCSVPPPPSPPLFLVSGRGACRPSLLPSQGAQQSAVGAGRDRLGLHGLRAAVQPRFQEAPLPAVRHLHVRLVLAHGCERQGG